MSADQQSQNSVEVRDYPFAVYLVSQKFSGTITVKFDSVDDSPYFVCSDAGQVAALRCSYEMDGTMAFCERYYQSIQELEVAVSIAALATGRDSEHIA